VKIAAIQMRCKVGDVAWNLRRSLELIKDAHSKAVDVLCFPESVLDGYACNRPELALCARAMDSREVTEIALAARRFETFIMWTLAEQVEDRIFNSAILFDRSGTIRTVYRKSHLCREENEHLSYHSGNRFATALVDNTRVGTMICFDRHFPEVARSLKLLGADIVLHPTATRAFSPDRDSLNTAMMRTRAYENRIFILSVNQENHGGGSALFAPWGEVVSLAGETEEIMYVEVDTRMTHRDMIDEHPTNRFDLISGRRPELYQIT
jgi:predicted amidohydrolase